MPKLDLWKPGPAHLQDACSARRPLLAGWLRPVPPAGMTRIRRVVWPRDTARRAVKRPRGGGLTYALMHGAFSRKDPISTNTT